MLRKNVITTTLYARKKCDQFFVLLPRDRNSLVAESLKVLWPTSFGCGSNQAICSLAERIRGFQFSTKKEV